MGKLTLEVGYYLPAYKRLALELGLKDLKELNKRLTEKKDQEGTSNE